MPDMLLMPCERTCRFDQWSEQQWAKRGQTMGTRIKADAAPLACVKLNLQNGQHELVR